MDRETIERLIGIDNAFYSLNAESFSRTRGDIWPGWQRVRDMLAGLIGRAGGATLLDIACGNMRLERYLSGEFPGNLGMVAIDNCPALLGDDGPICDFLEIDVLSSLLDGRLGASLPHRVFDVVTCFGFMHHVPGLENRIALLRTLLGMLVPGGHAIATFWRFADDPETKLKYQASTDQARRELGIPELEEGDYIRGWKDVPGAWRYCHSFTDTEVNGIVDALGSECRMADRFLSDGSDGKSNCYLVLERC